MARTDLQRVADPDLFDAREREACDVATACGGVLYRQAEHDGVYVAHLPPCAVGPRAVICINTCSPAAERLADVHAISDILLINGEEAPRVELRPDGRKCWVVPRHMLQDHGRRRRAAQDSIPRLIEHAFHTDSEK